MDSTKYPLSQTHNPIMKLPVSPRNMPETKSYVTDTTDLSPS